MAPSIYSPNSSPIQQDARLVLSALDFVAFGTATLTREAKGKYYWSIPASGTVELACNLGAILRNFNSAVVNYAYKGVPNGAISLKSATLSYLVSTANMTSATFGISATSIPANNVATTPTVTDLLAPTTLALVAQTDLYQTVLTPTNTGLLPLVTDLLIAELVVVTPASSVMHFYEAIIDLNYNI